MLLVPTIGFELMTYRLQGDCTTTVLSRHIGSRGRDRTYDQLINSQLHYRCATLEYSGLGRKNRTSISWSQTTNSTIKLHREKLERVWGFEPQLHSLEGWRHTLCLPAKSGGSWENQTPTSTFVALCNIHFTKDPNWWRMGGSNSHFMLAKHMCSHYH